MRSGATGTDDWTRQDFSLVAVFVLLSFGLYGALAFRLAQGVYLDYYNLAFDFDPIRTVDALASAPPDFLNFKHPLVVLLRPLAWPLLMIGLSAKESAALILAGFGSAGVALCFVFLRQASIERPIAAALTLLYMVTGTQIFTSIIAETYGLAGFSIILTWVIAQARIADPSRFRHIRYIAGIMTLGATITNVVQTFIAEMLIAWRWEGFARAIRRCFIFGIILAVLFTALAVAVWYNSLMEELKDPILAVKHVWWLQTKGPRTGAGEVLMTFFTFSFVSPVYSWLMLPEGINMRDFREYAFPVPGQIAAPLWLAFCAIGTVAGLCHRRYRVVASGLAVALVANLLFHLDFQFRGSLYLYASHMHFLIFALSAGLAPWLTTVRTSGKAYIAAVLLLAVLIGADNLPIASAFVTDFDTVKLNCVAPCTDTVGQ
ncbi:MAG: hypothetical protein EXR07_14855 [Acetobacteraceae bacterium]|nr:hypothetical protein [Acetobacteraceae bacterium]